MEIEELQARFEEMIAEGAKLSAVSHPLALTIAAYIALMEMEVQHLVIFRAFAAKLEEGLELFGMHVDHAIAETVDAAC